MRPVLLLCLALFGAAIVVIRADDDDECDCSRIAGGGLLRSRADNNDVEINRLTRLADQLQAKVEGLEGGHDMAGLAARVNAVTGNDCGDGQFQCSDRRGCVSALQVCDGESDCSDGSDESDNTCGETVPAGSSWAAPVTSQTQCFKAAAVQVRIVITKYERSDILPSLVNVEASTFLYTRDGSYNVGSATGTFNFGRGVLTLRANEGDILDLECSFNSYNHDQCIGHFSRNGEECGSSIFERE